MKTPSFYIIFFAGIIAVVLGIAMYSLAHYPIKDIEITHVSSTEHTQNTRVHAVLKNTLNEPWLLVDSKELTQTINQLNWVDNATITKSSIGVLSVEIKQKAPHFRWHKGYVISTKGESIKVDDEVWQAFDSLIDVESSTQHIAILPELLPFSAQLNKSKVASYFGVLRKINIDYITLTLSFKSHSIVVAKEQSQMQLLRFLQWLEQLPQDTVSSLIQQSQNFDLRYAHGFAIKQP